MTRGFRGATTVLHNDESEVLENTEKLILEIVEQNEIVPGEISHVFFSLTKDINAAFPAKAAREIPGWSHVPVMCMQEVDVPNSLEKCIRIMLVANTTKNQEEVKHIFLNEAVKLRPDLIEE